MEVKCPFCDIVSGTKKAKIVYQDKDACAFHDIHPQAPFHLLVIPKRHIVSLAEVGEEDEEILGHLLYLTNKLAHQQGFLEQGYRTVINTNRQAGQTVFHLHIHLLAGRSLKWPPG